MEENKKLEVGRQEGLNKREGGRQDLKKRMNALLFLIQSEIQEFNGVFELSNQTYINLMVRYKKKMCPGLFNDFFFFFVLLY